MIATFQYAKATQKPRSSSDRLEASAYSRARSDALGNPGKAVTGSKISPGLYESLELLGRDRALERIRRGAGASD